MNRSNKLPFMLALMTAMTELLLGCRGRVSLPDAGTDAAVASAAHCPPDEPPSGLDLPTARAAYRHHLRRHELRMLEALRPGSTFSALVSMLTPTSDQDPTCLGDLQQAGRIVFEHELGFVNGLGAGNAASNGLGPFRRVQRGDLGGPETVSCTSCHWRGGPGGAGAVVDNSYLLGDGDRIASGDARNPPPLHGVAVVELLASEMTRELATARDKALAQAAASDGTVTVDLEAKGISFGRLRAAPDGAVDTDGVFGVDPDLVVRPFGWKGNFVSLPKFVAESFQVHFGLQANVDAETMDAGTQPSHPQPPGNGPPADPDADGVEDELPDILLLSVVTYLASLPLPIVEPWRPLEDIGPIAEPFAAPTNRRFDDFWSRGRALFAKLGCASCHQPMLVLDDPVYRVQVGDQIAAFDLSATGAEPRLQYDRALGGYPVWLFSDLRRHDLGEATRSQHEHRGVDRASYQTRRLWGVAHSGPYLHDGRAPDFDTAIADHDGEAAPARRAFEALAREERGTLRTYLLSLRRAARLTIP